MYVPWNTRRRNTVFCFKTLGILISGNKFRQFYNFLKNCFSFWIGNSEDSIIKNQKNERLWMGDSINLDIESQIKNSYISSFPHGLLSGQFSLDNQSVFSYTNINSANTLKANNKNIKTKDEKRLLVLSINNSIKCSQSKPRFGQFKDKPTTMLDTIQIGARKRKLTYIDETELTSGSKNQTNKINKSILKINNRDYVCLIFE